MNIRNLKIGHRLSGGFGMVIALMITITAYAWAPRPEVTIGLVLAAHS